jgi:hypothetical protein
LYRTWEKIERELESGAVDMSRDSDHRFRSDAASVRTMSTTNSSQFSMRSPHRYSGGTDLTSLSVADELGLDEIEDQQMDYDSHESILSVQRKLNEQFGGVFSEHYIALKRYLASSLRDEKRNARSNRATDKLLQLSFAQFQELSTDVFDELLRRQQSDRRTPNSSTPDRGAPPYLLPKDSFHPKRNTARRKLSTLPPPRFRDLATDAFNDIERRFPQFATKDIYRMSGPASMRGLPNLSGTSVESEPPGYDGLKSPQN